MSVLCRGFGETSNHPGDSANPPTAQNWHPVSSGFFQNKITFERKEISDHWWDLRKYDGAADGDWENCVRSQGAYFEGDWSIIVLCTIFLISSSINVSIFYSTWLDTFWTDLTLMCLHSFCQMRFYLVAIGREQKRKKSLWVPWHEVPHFIEICFLLKVRNVNGPFNFCSIDLSKTLKHPSCSHHLIWLLFVHILLRIV